MACLAASAPPRSAADRIRVLVIDDSVVTRAVLHRALSACSDIEVVGQAARVRDAIDWLRAEAADVILLDLEMPGVGGLEGLPLLRDEAAGVPVLIVSGACDDPALAAHARRLGAVDVLPKPSGLGVAGGFATLLADRIRTAVGAAPAGAVPAGGAAPAQAPAAAVEFVRSQAAPCTAPVAIAASTGGVAALSSLLAALPSSMRAPILVTQHLPEAFIPYFAGQLAEATGRSARVADTGMPVIDGQILIAPGHAHLTLARTGGHLHVRLDQSPAASGCRPSADPMFTSLARLFGSSARGVVLSGMGRDGLEGAVALAAQGADIYVQDHATSVVWGMPGVVARAGLARAVLPPAGIASALAGEGGQEGDRWN